MATNEEILNAGFPAFPDPPADPPGPSDAATRYGNAFFGVQGTEATPTDYGSYLRRLPVLRSGQSVSSNTHTAADPGRVSDIAATMGSNTGAKNTRATGGISAGEVRVTYAADGKATLTFNSSDAVTECAYNIEVIPQAIIDSLDATSTPP